MMKPARSSIGRLLAHAPPHEPSPGAPHAHLLSDSLLQTIQASFQHADLHMIPPIWTAKVLISRLLTTSCVLTQCRGNRGLTACWFCRSRRRIRLSAYWRSGCRWRTAGPRRLRKRRHAQGCRRGHNNHKPHCLSPASSRRPGALQHAPYSTGKQASGRDDRVNDSI